MAQIPQARGQCLGIFHHLLPVVLKRRGEGFSKGNSLGRDSVHQGTSLDPRKDGRVDFLGPVFPANNGTSPGAPQGLVGGHRHDVGMRDWRSVLPGGNQASDMGHVDHEERTAFPGDFTQNLEIQKPRVGAGASEKDFRLQVRCLRPQGAVIHLLVLRGYTVVREVVEDPGSVLGVPMGEVAPMVEVHRQDAVPRVRKGQKSGLVGLRTAGGLHIRMVRIENLAQPIPGQIFSMVHELTAAVIPATWISLGVLVGQGRTQRFQDCKTGVVLAGNQLDLGFLATQLKNKGFVDLGVGLGSERKGGVHEANRGMGPA